ncbi:MAG: PACE efflux transporter [Aquabacterium sp.]
MQGPLRKVFHAVLFELIAIVIVTLALQWISDKGAEQSGGLALSTSLMALGWNMLFNTLFERWERRQASRARTVRRRIAHAVLFEGGLVVTTVPLIMWWLDMGWWEAIVTDMGLVGFFLVYGFCFNWVFDLVFGLPDSVRKVQ